ncbi:MAG: Npt1/Npt2 family nucleotide transporter [Chlamydiales bacterium]|nr:Npt1/Npt2 family nucleotide transporter [Chlamydiales bacterium]
MNQDSKAEFNKWRAFFWPIHRWELKKFLSMLGMFFLIALNYNVLRTFKDSLVITAPQAGAEAIPFIKVWAILPSALLLTFIFTRLANRYDREKVFYIMLSIFLGFFFLFTFVFYPLQDILHPHQLADQLQSVLPQGFKGLIAIFRNWTFTLFYVMSELWSTAIMSVLFWGFANAVTNVQEAKRYYGLLMIGANLASILAGQTSYYLSTLDYIPSFPYGTTKWEQSICFMTCLILVSGVITAFLFKGLNQHLAAIGEKIHEGLAPKAEKIKLSMRKNFAYLAQSKYLICIALIVLGYNIAINLIEVVWKNQIHAVYPNSSDFQAYMGQVTTQIGIVATLISMFVVSNVMRCFSWTVNAMIPVAIMFITGVGFFIFVIFQDSSAISPLTVLLGLTPATFGLMLGAMQNIFTRACKYTFFDATKEIAFIPLNEESKLKGKAAIDGIGSRLGKSGGSVIHQVLLIFCSTVAASTPYVAAVFLGIVTIWLLAVVSLGKKFDRLTIPKMTQKLSSGLSENLENQ